MLGPLHVLLLLAGLPPAADSGLTPRSPALAIIAAPRPYLSASGATTVGFLAGESIGRPREADKPLVPVRFSVPAVARALVELMWRASPTFRRQCARLAQGNVAVTLSFDLRPRTRGMDAWSEITRNGGLRAHIHMRGADARATENLAHEIEHILEQLDEVDLHGATAARVHGTTHARASDSFETSRAIAVGRTVAREIDVHQHGR